MIRSLRDDENGLYVALSDEDFQQHGQDDVLVFRAAAMAASSGPAMDDKAPEARQVASLVQSPAPAGIQAATAIDEQAPDGLPVASLAHSSASGGIRAATALPTDPLLASQWHLGNTGGLFDLRVQGVWNPASGAAYTGAGIRVVVIDDGFDYNHQDLAANYDQGLDFDFADVDLDPFGTSSDAHGTAVTGIIGADNNGTGAVGVAFDSSLVGYRTFGFITDQWLQNIRDAIHHAAVSAQGDVANISQGIANDAASEFGAGYDAARFDEIETSIGDAVGQGRGGLGMTIVKSAGNSRSDNYDVNADDWTNDTRQVVVAAVNQDGFVSSYSSYGAALLVSAFGTPGQVVTTDRTGAAGYNSTDFTSGFNGTSAAAPMVTGVVSLIYDANPGLGWRDVQSILALTARQVGSEVGAGTAGSERYLWQFNAASTWNGGGLHFSNDYGYGLVDALAAVRLAETWLDTTPAQTNGNQFTNTVDMLNATVVIPDGNLTGTSFTGSAGFDDEVDRVTVTITFSTTWLADLELYVISPDGTVSELIDDVAGDADFNGTWTFETQAFRGERAAGTWTVRIVDDAGGDTLSVSDVVLRTWGRFSADDRYVFTNEYSDYAGTFGHTTTIADANGGTDAFNASAVSSGSIINLNAGGASVIDGVALSIAAGTVIENAYGGDGNDTLIGNSVGNRLLGGRGNDSLDGGSGTDSLYGGDGDDTLSQNFGGPNEIMDGGADNDTGDWSYNLFDNWTIDLVAGTAQIGGTVYAQLTSIENVVGGQAADTIIGNSGPNRLDGQAGNDSLDGGGGTDSLYGGAGNDTLSQNTGGPNEIMDGGADNDTGDWSYNNFGFAWTIDLAAGTAVAGGTTWAQLVSIENAVGTQNNDTIIGTGGANRLDGHIGNDSLDGGSGTDSLYGGAGNDTLSQNTGGPNEIMDGGADNDTGDWSYNNFGFAWTIDLAAGTAVSDGTTWAQLVSIENAVGTQNNDTIIGAGGANRLDGHIGDDSLDGGGGTDSLYGGAGNDTLSQNTGGPNEIMDGGADNDTGDWSYNNFGFAWTIDLAAGTAVSDGTTWAQLVSIENAVGTQNNDTIIGAGGANRLDGHIGDDSLDGGGGTDSLYGGAGNDTLSQNTGGPNEIMDGGADNDTGDWSYNNFGFAWTIDLAAGTAVSDGTTWAQLVSIENAVGTQNNDTIIGTGGANRLDGHIGNDSLDGGSGTDSLYGGAGNDTLSQNTGGPNEIMDGGADNDTGDWSYNNFGFAWTIDLAAGTAVSDGTTWAQLVSIENAIGTQNNDTIIGTGGANRLDGHIGNDSLDGGSGTDSLYGGAGNDTLSQNFGGPNEVMDGGADNDTGDWSYSVSDNWAIDLAAGTAKIGATTFALLTSIENVVGGQLGDTIAGDAGANRLDGQAGGDSLLGQAGNDTLLGGTGIDTLDGGDDNDLLLIGGAEAASETFRGGSGNDLLQVIAGSGPLTLTTLNRISGVETLDGSGEIIQADSGSNLLDFSTFTSVVNVAAINGLTGNDTIIGSNNADTIDGGKGNDSILAGGDSDLVLIAGTEAQGDTINGGAGALDTLRVRTGSGALTLQTTQNFAGFEAFDGAGQAILGTANADFLNFSTFGSVVNLGSIVTYGGNDTVLGSNGADTIDGRGGNDSILAGGDNDLVLIAGTEAQGDTIDGGAGALDTLRIRAGTGGLTLTTLARFTGFEVFDASGQSVLGTAGSDFLNFSTFASVINLASIGAGSGNDTVIGTSNADTIDGRNGNDSILGGDGNDRFLVSITDARGDTIDGGAGALDTLQIRAGSGPLTLTTLANFTGIEVFDGSGQIVWGTTAGDFLNFSTFNSVINLASIITFDGNDTVIGGGGGDTIDGRGGSDSIDGRGGNDSILAGGGDDLVSVAGTEALGDTLDGGTGTLDTLQIRAGTGALTLTTLANVTGFEVFNGSGQNVQGTSSADFLNFSTFTSVVNVASIIGYQGNDTIVGG
ncbi:S8 family serine peptidase, partial [Neoroseomonas lacus]|uniref:S8 family serine peptidase n=1 Tax=Neoroseomonas lacus TaxID=287609 RepID=UPI001665734C